MNAFTKCGCKGVWTVGVLEYLQFVIKINEDVIKTFR